MTLGSEASFGQLGFLRRPSDWSRYLFQDDRRTNYLQSTMLPNARHSTALSTGNAIEWIKHFSRTRSRSSLDFCMGRNGKTPWHLVSISRIRCSVFKGYKRSLIPPDLR